MSNRPFVRLAMVAGILLSSAGVLTRASSQVVGPDAGRDVIVILRDQIAGVPPERGLLEARAAAISNAHAPIMDHLRKAGSGNIREFHLINAVAAHVSKAEADQLAAHPLVQAVVPDRVIKLPRPAHDRFHFGPATLGFAAATPSAGAALTLPSSLCNTLEPEALQLTHTAFLDPTTPQAQSVLDGNGQTVIGRGVKVAFIADGLDPTIAGFVRPDGSKVFFDYRDFTGDAAGVPTSGEEAFGDASSVAAQDDPNGKPLRFDISRYSGSAFKLPSPCNIQIRGMAPGASLAGLKVFNSQGASTTSSIVQAIEWAVSHDDVDVINESFGENYAPDNGNDPVSLADAAAVAAGVVVVASTGDAGSQDTLGSPSTDPDVIAVGASTQFRSYAQLAYANEPLGHGTYVSNNISSLSSGGFAQMTPRTVDVVAPGDLGWALCSSNVALYVDCTDLTPNFNPVPYQIFGGTSEASPLTAGAAALVIQAYRSVHHGDSPSPALVKQIIMSTATDLGAPASEQGAGLINALAAVDAALSIGRSKRTGSSDLTSPTSAPITDAPNAAETRSFSVTNTGAAAQTVVPAFETLGPAVAGSTFSVKLNAKTDPMFQDAFGDHAPYVKKTFTVPAGAQHLDASIAWVVPFSGGQSPLVYLGLFDPSGREAAYSLAQGSDSGYGHVDVVAPAAGTWTAVIWTFSASGDLAVLSYTGNVQFSWSAENYVSMGTVSPAKLDLAPGATQSFTVRFRMPANPGDVSAAVRFTANAGTAPGAIPVPLRAMVPTTAGGGAFNGTLTGGNGRAGTGPMQTYYFDVPSGVDNMSTVVELADNGYNLEGYLIDPNGMPLDIEPNVDVLGDEQFGLQLQRSNPQPGRWRFILMLDYFASGNQTSIGYNVRIGFNTAPVAASGMPNSAGTHLSASAGPVVIPVTVTNQGPLVAAYFADARLNTQAWRPLKVTQDCISSTTLPGACAAATLPTQVSQVQFSAQSSAPIGMDAFPNAGYIYGFGESPDILAKSSGKNSVTASLSEPEVPWGQWLMFPALIGPFGPAGAPATPYSAGATVLMKEFDPAVSADSGDFWADSVLGTVTFNPLILAPGESGTINVTITPDKSKVGETVAGVIYIDSYSPVVNTGSEVAQVPYRYTVAK
ncbi:MAG TPA: S8 family serine peptidase [Steroidobacteraceae bacterium]|jgi:hypothetical protein|nr:S8 family serine peptidase [Steroidobacteraceae bacterium]